jgi:hypothetical protein
MKKSSVLLSLLLGGCVTAEKDDNRGMCTKFMPIPDRKIECAGGRGVAPQICVEKTVIKQFCVRYETL